MVPSVQLSRGQGVGQLLACKRNNDATECSLGEVAGRQDRGFPIPATAISRAVATMRRSHPKS